MSEGFGGKKYVSSKDMRGAEAEEAEVASCAGVTICPTQIDFFSLFVFCVLCFSFLFSSNIKFYI